MLDYLAKLISFDTQNPPGHDLEMVAYLKAELQSGKLAKPDRIEHVVVVPGQHSYVAAIYGTPKKVINVHCDTVPANSRWSLSPFKMTIKDEKAYGLGSADTKCNIAILLDLLKTIQPKDCLLLFSGDEENAGSVCIKAFLKTDLASQVKQAIICEPTDLHIGIRHRGFVKFKITASGPGGHSSLVDELPNPLIEVSKMAVILDGLGKKYKTFGKNPFFGLCLNVGKISGGVAANVIPSQVVLDASLRPPLDFNVDGLFQEMQSEFDQSGLKGEIKRIFNGAAFQTENVDAFREAFADSFDKQLVLDFWTETALFQKKGINSVVFGPGSVCQAHGPDEFVTIADLQIAKKVYERFLIR